MSVFQSTFTHLRCPLSLTHSHSLFVPSSVGFLCIFVLIRCVQISCEYIYLCISAYLRFGTAVAACIGGGTVYGNGNFAATAGFSNNIFIVCSCSGSMMITVAFCYLLSLFFTFYLFSTACYDVWIKCAKWFFYLNTKHVLRLFNWKRFDFFFKQRFCNLITAFAMLVRLFCSFCNTEMTNNEKKNLFPQLIFFALSWF